MCPRCSRELRKENDYYGEYLFCILCGYHKDIIKEVVIPESVKGHFTPSGRRKKYERRKGMEWKEMESE